MAEIAILIDVLSIQKYIFSSNKLKVNLGASYVVKKLFDGIEKYDGMKKIYSGGGSTLIYADNEKNTKNFLNKWTAELLKNYPGLKVNCAIDYEFDETNFRESLNNLYKKLNENKGKYITKTSLPSYGFNAECSFTGLTQENFYEEGRYISKEAYVKIKECENADKSLSDEYKEILGNNYRFTNQIDELGSSKGEDSHIAVVHIDGNNIGQKFRDCKSAGEIKELSDKLKEAVNKGFLHLLKHIIKHYGKISEILDLKSGILPIRPIVLGGDDITFVCDGKLGVYFAKIYMEKFEEFKDIQGENLSSSAGVVIVKNKYPFYRAYEIAEALCANAKKARREKYDNGSWMDFYIAYGNINMNLDDLRKKHFTVDDRVLTMWAYKLKNDQGISLESIIEGIKQFKDWPNSKIKKFREVLFEGEDEREHFRLEAKIRGREIPNIGEINYDKFFHDKKTPYLDIIELKEYFPDFLVKEE